MARAVASQLDANFLKVVSSAIVDKYIGESARLIREMFNYARDHQPCIIFMDEIDAIGGRRFSEGTSADREIQRTLMELLNQMDGFDVLGKVKMIMATNRPDTLDPALLRPGNQVQFGEQEGNDPLDLRLLSDIVMLITYVIMVITSVANYELNDELIISSL